MEKLDPVVPWEALVTRSIVHLLQETNADNRQAEERPGFQPQYHWKQAADVELAEMEKYQKKPMKMARPPPAGI